MIVRRARSEDQVSLGSQTWKRVCLASLTSSNWIQQTCTALCWTKCSSIRFQWPILSRFLVSGTPASAPHGLAYVSHKRDYWWMLAASLQRADQAALARAQRRNPHCCRCLGGQVAWAFNSQATRSQAGCALQATLSPLSRFQKSWLRCTAHPKHCWHWS